MISKQRFLVRITCALVLAAAFALPVGAQDVDCVKCHSNLSDKKVVHGAVRMGCAICHAEIDASATPHKSKSKIAKGLATEPPALCLKCHEARLFEGKFTHGPVATGMCLGCHNPHASEHQGLLNKEPAALCLDCHPEVRKGPHVIAGVSRSGHPLGNDKKDVEDPLRPGKKFYCASCHEPHRSDRLRLNRFDKGMASCLKCHKM